MQVFDLLHNNKTFVYIVQGLPLKFGKEHMKGKHIKIILRHGHDDFMLVVGSTYPRHNKLLGGWDDIVEKYDLTIGDTIVFVVEEPNPWKMAIVRNK